MSINPEHGKTGSFLVIPHSNYAVIANLCRGQQCCVTIKSQSRHLQRKNEAHTSKRALLTSLLYQVKSDGLNMAKRPTIKTHTSF